MDQPVLAQKSKKKILFAPSPSSILQIIQTIGFFGILLFLIYSQLNAKPAPSEGSQRVGESQQPLIRQEDLSSVVKQSTADIAPRVSLNEAGAIVLDWETNALVTKLKVSDPATGNSIFAIEGQSLPKPYTFGQLPQSFTLAAGGRLFSTPTSSKQYQFDIEGTLDGKLAASIIILTF